MRLLAATTCWHGRVGCIADSGLRIRARSRHKARSADIIVTAAPVYEPLAALRGQERFPEGAQLLLVHAGQSGAAGDRALPPRADANVSFDGKQVLFAGKQAAGDPWQIWELTLADRSVRKLIASDSRCDSSVLSCRPGSWFTRSALRQGFQLESAENGRPPTDRFYLTRMPGPTLLPLSYLQGERHSRRCAADGRILFEANFPLGSGSRRSCFWSIPMVRAWSRIAAIMGGRAGAEGNWLRAMWSLRMALRWRASLRRWRMRFRSLRRVLSMPAQLPRRLQGDWLVSARTHRLAHYALKLLKSGLPNSASAALANRVCRERRRSRRSGSGCAAHAAQSSSVRAASLELRQSARSRCAPVARGRSEDSARVGAAGDAWTRKATQSRMGTAPVEAGWFLLCAGSWRQADSLCTARRKGSGSAAGTWLVLDSQRRTAHLRRLPHGTGARVGKSRAGRVAADHNSC